MENRDDKMIIDWMEKHRVEISDNGFSNRVIHRLPAKKRDWSWIVGACTLIGVVVVALLVDWQVLLSDILTFIFNTPIIYLAGGMFVVAVGVLIYVLYREEEYLFVS